MPYIKPSERVHYNDILKRVGIMHTKGDLEYCIFKLMRAYMSTREFKYTPLHDCVYAAQHCADEFRRRYLDKREDEAMTENGDIM